MLAQPAGDPMGRTARHWGAKAGVEGCGGAAFANPCQPVEPLPDPRAFGILFQLLSRLTFCFAG